MLSDTLCVLLHSEVPGLWVRSKRLHRQGVHFCFVREACTGMSTSVRRSAGVNARTLLQQCHADHARCKCGSKQQVHPNTSSLNTVQCLMLSHIGGQPAYCGTLLWHVIEPWLPRRYLVRRCLRRRDWHDPLAWIGVRPIGHDDQSAGGERQHRP